MSSLWHRDKIKWPQRLAMPGITPGAMRIGLALFARSDNDTGECWPSYKTLAEDTGLCVDTVKRSVKILEAVKLITVERGKWRGKHSTFWLHLPPEKGCTVARLSPKRGAPVRGKGCKSPDPYRELTQRTQKHAQADDAWPGRHQVRVEQNSHQSKVWREWLVENGWDEPESLGLIDQHEGLLVPFHYPPEPGEHAQQGITAKFLAGAPGRPPESRCAS